MSGVMGERRELNPRMVDSQSTALIRLATSAPLLFELEFQFFKTLRDFKRKNLDRLVFFFFMRDYYLRDKKIKQNFELLLFEFAIQIKKNFPISKVSR